MIITMIIRNYLVNVVFDFLFKYKIKIMKRIKNIKQALNKQVMRIIRYFLVLHQNRAVGFMAAHGQGFRDVTLKAFAFLVIVAKLF